MSSSAPQQQRIYQRMEGLLTASVDGGVLMMSAELGRYFNLNPVAGRIWELLAEPLTIDALVERLGEEYDAPLDTIRAEAGAFLDRMDGEGLLKPAARHP